MSVPTPEVGLRQGSERPPIKGSYSPYASKCQVSGGIRFQVISERLG